MAVPRRSRPILIRGEGVVSGPLYVIGSWARTLVVAAVVASCTSEPNAVAGITDSAYVEIMSRLAAIGQIGVTHGPDFLDSARTATLDSVGVAPEQLSRFADVRGADPARMRVLWDQIIPRMDSLVLILDPSRVSGSDSQAVLSPLDSAGAR